MLSRPGRPPGRQNMLTKAQAENPHVGNRHPRALTPLAHQIRAQMKQEHAEAIAAGPIRPQGY